MPAREFDSYRRHGDDVLWVAQSARKLQKHRLTERYMLAPHTRETTDGSEPRGLKDYCRS